MHGFVASPTTVNGHEKDIDRPGGDYTSDLLPADSHAGTCESICRRESLCAACTSGNRKGIEHNSNRQGSDYNPSEEIGMRSGVRRGYEINVNRPGNDIQEIAIADRRPWNCQAACARNSACRSWSMSLFTGRCFLKNGIPAAQAADGTVSGRKGMEFF